MNEIRRATFKRDFATLCGHIRGGLKGDGFGENARQQLDALWELTMQELATTEADLEPPTTHDVCNRCGTAIGEHTFEVGTPGLICPVSGT